MNVEELHEEELEIFLIWLKDRGYSQDTQTSYMHDDVRTFLSNNPDKPNGTLRKIDEMAHLTRGRKAGSGDRARNRSLSAISLFFKVMIEFERIEVNPANDGFPDSIRPTGYLGQGTEMALYPFTVLLD
ncbi:hypothetical protein ACFPYJ_29830 [Paenibacillus solisilvae]|uniref:Core-binding (CB) domain-containing protein n=1 Tax=Paenibacillus solisilvae TaxID=2486751 RepID=A0ABW0W4W2_9BACL